MRQAGTTLNCGFSSISFFFFLSGMQVVSVFRLLVTLFSRELNLYKSTSLIFQGHECKDGIQQYSKEEGVGDGKVIL